MTLYPVMLNVAGRDCLVVGGGRVALRKVEGLAYDQDAPVSRNLHVAFRGRP